MGGITKSKIFCAVCLSVVLGVGIRSFFTVPVALLYAAGMLGCTVMLVWWASKPARLIGLSIIALTVGVVRYELAMPAVDGGSIASYNGTAVRFAGIVAAEPDQRKDHTKLTVEAQRGIAGAPAALHGKVLVKTTPYPAYGYGDLLDITCSLVAPEPIEFETDVGIRTFRYDQYLSRFSIYSLCYRPSITKAAAGQGNVLLGGALAVKGYFVSLVQDVFAEPHASFLNGLLLGAKKSIPDDLMEAFNRTGTTHIVALSGYNIAIIAVLVQKLCLRLWISRKRAFWASLGAICFFVLITGAQASVLRAGIMGMLVLLALQLGRLSRITNTLVLAAAVMVLINPKVLVFDAGFQLSFLATIGLVYVSPQLERLFSWVPAAFELRGSLTATLAATAMTLPLIIFQFGRLSAVSPVVNVLILPAIPIAMGFGFVTGLAALVSVGAARVLGWIVWAILSYIMLVVEFFSNLPFSSFNIGQISWLWVAVSYVTIAVLILLSRQPGRQRA
ncbi:MAG: ComEC/Rec2 family competence protein [Patescibacteria group bacterium]